MPRLLQIDSCLGILSTGRITEGIAALASENGWECYIAHGARYVGRSKMRSYQVDTRLGEYLHFAGSLLFDRHGLGSLEATKRLVDKIETEIKPDIIHLHCIHGYYLNYEVLFEYLNRTDIPVVWTFHDCWAFTGHCAHFITGNCFKWRDDGCQECSLIRSYPMAIQDSSARNYALKKELFTCNPNLCIVAVSDWMASLVKLSFLKDKSITVIKNGVDLHDFYPCASKRAKPVILGVASTWGNDKGLADFYKLRELLPEEEYDIKLVGLTDKQIECMPNGIEGIRRTDSVQNLARTYSEATILVNPTYADTYPTVNLEALACGTPVITYDTGGSPESIDENTGMVVSCGDILGLANAIKHITEHPFRIEVCRNRAEALFDKNMCFVKYMDLYNELLNNQGNRQ